VGEKWYVRKYIYMGSVPQGSPPSTSILSRNNNSCFVFLTVVVNLMTQSWHDSSNVYLTAHMHTRMTRPHTRPLPLSSPHGVKASQGIGYGVWGMGIGPRLSLVSGYLASHAFNPSDSLPFPPVCSVFLCPDCLSLLPVGTRLPSPNPYQPKPEQPQTLSNCYPSHRIRSRIPQPFKPKRSPLHNSRYLLKRADMPF